MKSAEWPRSVHKVFTVVACRASNIERFAVGLGGVGVEATVMFEKRFLLPSGKVLVPEEDDAPLSQSQHRQGMSNKDK
jgi:hypothetical protein